MKRLITLILSMCYLISIHATINKNEAFRIASTNTNDSKNEIWISNQPFSNGDTIYMWNGGFVICPYEDAWGVFIDNHPMQNWEHDCQYGFVDLVNGEYIKFDRTSPPRKISKYWTKLKSFYPAYLNDTLYTNSEARLKRPTFQIPTHKQKGNRINPDNSNLYAIIIDYCGENSEYNHERFWNDCSAMYTTLLNNGYPRNHIYVAMPTDESGMPNLHLTDGGFIASPVDLDEDGINDVGYAATRDGLDKLLYDISNVIKNEDVLLVYITGHGDNAPNMYCNYFGVLTDGIYHDSQLVGKLKSMDIGILNFIVQRSGTYFLSENDSTQFLSDTIHFHSVLSYDDVVGTITDSLSIDQYTYHWTEAVNCGNISISDLNNDGYTSMYEAHRYAATNNTRAKPSYRPYQNSHPVCLVHALTLTDTISHELCLSSDLYIKDNSEDFGLEPNSSTNLSYISPDIWLEDVNGNVAHQLFSNEQYYVCVRVHNKGNDSSDSNAVLHVHWTKAMIGGKWPDSWITGSIYDCNGTAVNPGGEITPDEGWDLPSIAAGEQYIARIPWITPNNADYSVCTEFVDNMEQLWHYCLMARIYEGDDTPGADLTYQPFNNFVLNSNNVASRNITIMHEIGNDIVSAVGIIAPYEGLFSLKCRLYSNIEYFVNEVISVNVYLDNDLQINWSGLSYGFYDLGGKLQMTAPIAKIQNISLSDENLYSIFVEVEDGTLSDFYLDISLENSDGVIVGGERFLYIPGTPTLNRIAPIQFTENKEDTYENITQNTLDNAKRVIVFNGIGQVVTYSEDAIQNNTKNLPKGVYTIIVESSEGITAFKIVR